MRSPYDSTSVRRIGRAGCIHVEKYLREARSIAVAIGRVSCAAALRNLGPARRLRVLPCSQIQVRRCAQRFRRNCATRRRRALIERVEDGHLMQSTLLHPRTNVFDRVDPDSGIILHALPTRVDSRAIVRSSHRFSPRQQIRRLFFEQSSALLLVEEEDRVCRKTFALCCCDCIRCIAFAQGGG